MTHLTAEAEYFRSIIFIQERFFDGVIGIAEANEELKCLNETNESKIDPSLIKEKIANIQILGDDIEDSVDDDMWMESQVC